jgi:hypothetical protein
MTGVSLTAALIATAVLGISFRTTRAIGIAAFAAICFLYPWFVIGVVVCVAAIAHHLLRRR